ncbi:MAG: hypothetical protein WCP15_01760 [bacterium]
MDGLELLGRISPGFKDSPWDSEALTEAVTTWLFHEGDCLKKWSPFLQRVLKDRLETNFYILQSILPIPGMDFRYYMADENKQGITDGGNSRVRT